jgi:hypothetical protein
MRPERKPLKPWVDKTLTPYPDATASHETQQLSLGRSVRLGQRGAEHFHTCAACEFLERIGDPRIVI